MGKFIWERLVEAFKEAKTEKDVEEIFDDLFTPGEKIMFSKRSAIAILLEKGKTYFEISQLLKVSSATINAVKNSIRRSGIGYKRLINKTHRQFLDRILDRLK